MQYIQSIGPSLTSNSQSPKFYPSSVTESINNEAANETNHPLFDSMCEQCGNNACQTSPLRLLVEADIEESLLISSTIYFIVLAMMEREGPCCCQYLWRGQGTSAYLSGHHSPSEAKVLNIESSYRTISTQHSNPGPFRHRQHSSCPKISATP